MNNRLATIIAGIADGILMLVMLLAWWIVVMLLAGFAEIITGWNLILTTAGGIIIALVLPLGLTIASYLILWKRYCSLPIRGLLLPGKSNKAFKGSLALLGALAALYLVMWGISATVFGTMLSRQEKTLENLGVPNDWKMALPVYRADHNAGPLLWQVADSIRSRLPADGKPLSQLYAMLPALSDNPDTLKYLAPLIDRLTILNGTWLAKADSALVCTLLVWKDYRAMSIDSLIEMRIPNYMGVQTLHRLYVLSAVKRAAAGDWGGCRKYFDKASKLQSLLAQDPSLFARMISIVNAGTTCEGLAVIAKIERNRPEAYALINDVLKRMPPVEGNVRKGLVSEFSVFYGLWKTQQKHIINLLLLSNAKKGIKPESIFRRSIINICGGLLYNVWGPWDRYCYLKSAKKGLTQPVDVQFNKDNNYFDNLLRLTSLASSMVVPNFSGMYRREREAIVKIAATRLFTAAIEYKRTKGHYPATLSLLVPEFILNVPKSAVDGSEFSYQVLPDKMLVQAKAFDGAALPKYTVIKSN